MTELDGVITNMKSTIYSLSSHLKLQPWIWRFCSLYRLKKGISIYFSSLKDTSYVSMFRFTLNICEEMFDWYFWTQKRRNTHPKIAKCAKSWRSILPLKIDHRVLRSCFINLKQTLLYGLQVWRPALAVSIWPTLSVVTATCPHAPFWPSHPGQKIVAFLCIFITTFFW